MDSGLVLWLKILIRATKLQFHGSVAQLVEQPRMYSGLVLWLKNPY